MDPNDADDRIPAQPSLSTVLTRRNLLAATAIGLPAAGALRAVLAHDDHDDESGGKDDHDDHDDDDHEDKDDDDRKPGGDDDDDAVEAAGQATSGMAEVVIDDDDEDGFSPGTIEIGAGETVTFINRDDKPHTATGSDWDTGTIEPGDSAPVTFDEPGTFAYACQFHPVMTGTVVVGAGDATPEASPAASPEAAAAGETTVTIVNFAFEPAEIEVAAGSTVTWSNQDQVPHTATADDGSFDTDRIGGGESGSVTFETAGTFTYVCNFHPNMKGTITVT